MKKMFVAIGVAIAVALAGGGVSSAGVHQNVGDGVLVYTENGAPMCVGLGSGGANPGQPVIQKSNSANCVRLYETEMGVDINGFPKYLFAFSNPAHGNYMASTNDCRKVTIKSSVSSNGTVWIFAPIGGHIFLVPQYCNGHDEYDVVMASDDVAGHQWQVSSDLSLYRKIVIES
jgi:hypothetical protein